MLNYTQLHTLFQRCEKIESSFQKWRVTHDTRVLATVQREADLLKEDTSNANLRTMDNLNVSRIVGIVINGLNGVVAYGKSTRIVDTKLVDKSVNQMEAALTPFKDSLSMRAKKLREFGDKNIELVESAHETAQRVEKSFRSIDELRTHVFDKAETDKKRTKVEAKLEEAMSSENLLLAVTIERMEAFVAESVKKINLAIRNQGLGTKVSYVVVEGPVIIKTKTPIWKTQLDNAGIKYSYLNNASSHIYWQWEDTSIDKIRQSSQKIAKPVTSPFVILFNQKLIVMAKPDAVSLIKTDHGVFRSRPDGKPKKDKKYREFTVEEIFDMMKAKTGKTYLDLMSEIPTIVKNTKVNVKPMRNKNGEIIYDAWEFDKKRKVVKQQQKTHNFIHAKKVDAVFLWAVDKEVYNKLGPIPLDRVTVPF